MVRSTKKVATPGVVGKPAAQGTKPRAGTGGTRTVSKEGLRAAAAASQPLSVRLRVALDALKRGGSKAGVAGYARYGIHVDRAFGTPMSKVQAVARLNRGDHELAMALWKSGWHEARLLAPYVADPAHLTPAEMDAWCEDFDNWATCDTACFVLFDRSPHAFAKVSEWAKRKDEFGRRAAFALLASLALHDKHSEDAAFLRLLPLAERAATDERNFVKKAVSWALRGVGSRSSGLQAATVQLADRLAASKDATERWVGRDVLRDISRPLAVKRAEKKSSTRG